MDRRLIRTAVFGNPESDEPALCPEAPEELDRFRAEHQDETIWCGTLLEGGCGRQLMTRRYADKVCHFAHHASDDGLSCGRQARDTGSANHLFAKYHLASWLRGHGINAEFTYPEPLGSAVMIRLEDDRQLLVHLDRECEATWDSSMWEIICGPGVRTPRGILEQRGYVHRIRLVPRSGGGRTVLFGTEVRGEGTGRWVDLDEVHITPEGLTSTTSPPVIPITTA
ncbi:hypothetical protein ACIPWL_28660 [Streptomyces sp. NPDC090023]|uniref:hypothetical protein n=1 Tax=unclassified Streptomyces TaxID=2593676 RepID=UPI00380E896D